MDCVLIYEGIFFLVGYGSNFCIVKCDGLFCVGGLLGSKVYFYCFVVIIEIDIWCILFVVYDGYKFFMLIEG